MEDFCVQDPSCFEGVTRLFPRDVRHFHGEHLEKETSERKWEKERCSGSYCQAVTFLVINRHMKGILWFKAPSVSFCNTRKYPEVEGCRWSWMDGGYKDRTFDWLISFFFLIFLSITRVLLSLSLPGDLSFGILFIWKLHQIHFVFFFIVLGY